MKHDPRLCRDVCVRTGRLFLSVCCLTLWLLTSENALAAQNPDKLPAALKQAESYYSVGDIQRAEPLAKELIGTESDADGSATVLLASIYKYRKEYKQALDLLHHHKALAALYIEAPQRNMNESGREWSNRKTFLYARLKSLHGRLRFQLGQQDESVLKDLLAGISSSYTLSDQTYLPDVEALQFAAGIYLFTDRYEESIFYFNELLAGLTQIEAVADKKDFNKLEDIKYLYHGTEYNIACAYAKLGNVDQTIIWLGKSLAYKPLERFAVILTDHCLDNVRETLRFKDFIRHVRGEK